MRERGKLRNPRKVAHDSIPGSCWPIVGKPSSNGDQDKTLLVETECTVQGEACSVRPRPEPYLDLVSPELRVYLSLEQRLFRGPGGG